jgi:hypothetical protein
MRSREVALCVWCYAKWPEITESHIEVMAQSDPVIMEQRRQKKISTQGKRRAKSLLGLDTPKEDDIDPSLSHLEREILLDLRATFALVEAYKKTEARMRKAEAAFEIARAKLHAIEPQSARNLAEFDHATRPILTAEGLLGDPSTGFGDAAAVTPGPTPTPQPAAPPVASLPPAPRVAAPPVAPPPAAPQVAAPQVAAPPPVAPPPVAPPPVAPPPVAPPPVAPPTPVTAHPVAAPSEVSSQPATPAVTPPTAPASTSVAGETAVTDPADAHADMAAADIAVNMLKKKVHLAPSSSIVDVDDVDGLLDGEDDELDDDFHAKMDDCTKDAKVYWPDDRESLFD